MTERHAWMSEALIDSTIVCGFSIAIELGDKHAWIALSEMLTRRESIPAARYPAEMTATGSTDDRFLRRAPDLILSRFELIVSGAVAEVLRQFDLGRSALYPVALRFSDGQTPVPGAYHFLNIAEERRSLLPDQSLNLRYSKYSSRPWRMMDPRNQDVALSATPPPGVDLWWEQEVLAAVFLSDRLVQALKAAGLARKLKPVRCRLVEPN